MQKCDFCRFSKPSVTNVCTGEFRTRNVVFKDALTCGMEHNMHCEPRCDAERVEVEEGDAFEAVPVANPRPSTPGMDMEDVDSDAHSASDDGDE